MRVAEQHEPSRDPGEDAPQLLRIDESVAKLSEAATPVDRRMMDEHHRRPSHHLWVLEHLFERGELRCTDAAARDEGWSRHRTGKRDDCDRPAQLDAWKGARAQIAGERRKIATQEDVEATREPALLVDPGQVHVVITGHDGHLHRPGGVVEQLARFLELALEREIRDVGGPTR
jgi:hypothetical protein